MSRIEVSELNKLWPGTKAVDNVSFVAQEGSLNVLLGPSGCGKSTILRLIAGLESVTSGNIYINHREITTTDPSNRGISMVFQSYALFPHLNVAENILFGLKVRRVSRHEQNQRLKKASLLVGLDGLLERKPSQLSGGQRQRVALARTIVAQQPVCLMDEPLSNLDAKLRAEMRDEIRSLQQQLGLTMLYVTHDQTEAMTMADQVILLQSGKVEQIGTPKQLYDRPSTAFGAQFLGQPPMNVVSLDDIVNAQGHPSLPNLPREYYQGKGWSLGIRPEDIKFADSGLPVTVEGIDYLGAEAIIKLRHGKQFLAAKMPGQNTFQQGKTYSINWEENSIHIFDDKGKRRGRTQPSPPNVV